MPTVLWSKHPIGPDGYTWTVCPGWHCDIMLGLRVVKVFLPQPTKRVIRIECSARTRGNYVCLTGYKPGEH